MYGLCLRLNKSPSLQGGRGIMRLAEPKNYAEIMRKMRKLCGNYAEIMRFFPIGFSKRTSKIFQRVDAGGDVASFLGYAPMIPSAEQFKMKN